MTGELGTMHVNTIETKELETEISAQRMDLIQDARTLQILRECDYIVQVRKLIVADNWDAVESTLESIRSAEENCFASLATIAAQRELGFVWDEMIDRKVRARLLKNIREGQVSIDPLTECASFGTINTEELREAIRCVYLIIFSYIPSQTYILPIFLSHITSFTSFIRPKITFSSHFCLKSFFHPLF